ncbi:MAG TPA: YCF48-related protein [Blastocatellia bacterium]|nr:YCF48-related protein [Blastocatellia bacterium]
MKRPVVEKTIRLLIAIAFSIQVAMAQNRSFTIQVESWVSEADARSSVARLRAQGLEAYWVRMTVPGMGLRHRVRIGRYPNQTQARAKADQLLGAGAIKEFIITIYDAEPSDSEAPDKSKPEISSSSQPGRQPGNRPGRTADKSAPRKGKNIPKSPGESERSAARPRKAADAEPAAGASGAEPAAPEAPADMTINNNSWTVASRGVGSDQDLRAVHFVDSTTGWAAGAAGAVYRTTDGGKNWEPLSSGAAVDISHISFIDRNRGWMLGRPDGKMSDEAGNESILFITNNGGRTWTRKPLPNVTSLHFIDARTGWAVGMNSTLLKTTDGGMEWSKVVAIDKLIKSPIDSSDHNFGFSDIQFTDAKHGWLIGNFYEQARGDIGGIFATSDGGDTWRRVPLTIQTKNNPGRFTPGSLHSVNFKDTNTGSITGEMYDGEKRFFFALHTRDSGASWSLFRIPSRSTHSSQFMDPARGWTAAFAQRANEGASAPYDTILLRTDSGGLSWRVDLIARGRRIRRIFFLSPTRGWAVGDKGMILSYEEKPKAN